MPGKSLPLKLIPSITGLKLAGFVLETILVSIRVSSSSYLFNIELIVANIVYTNSDVFGYIAVWKYDGAKDSVYQVTKEDYISCNTTNPIEQHKDGETKVELTRPGPYYFISGVKSNCEKGEKMIVVVLTPRHRFDISPAPSPAEFDGPAVAPTSGGSSLKSGLVLGLLGGLVLGMF